MHKNKYSKYVHSLVNNNKQDETQIEAYPLGVSMIHNRLLYTGATKLKNKVKDPVVKEFFEDVYKRGSARLKTFEQTIQVIERMSKKNSLEYLIAKRERNNPYVSSDIDLLIKDEDLDTWINLFKKEGFTVEDHMEFMGNKTYQRTVFKDGFYKIDLTVQFCWQSNLYFSEEFLWEGSDKKTKSVSKEADFLINFATVIFKKYHYSLLDYEYLKKLESQGLDKEKISNEVENHNWTYIYKLSYKHFKNLDINKDKFPAVFPIWMCLVIFFNSLINGRFSFNSFTYYVLSRIRFIMFPLMLPGHVWWVPIKEFSVLKGRKIKL